MSSEMAMPLAIHCLVPREESILIKSGFKTQLGGENQHRICIINMKQVKSIHFLTLQLKGLK